MGVKDIISSVDITCLRIICVGFVIYWETNLTRKGTGVSFFGGGSLETAALVCAIINLLMGRGTVRWGNGSSTKKILCIVGAVCMGLVTFWAFIALIWWHVRANRACDRGNDEVGCGFVWSILIFSAIASTIGFITDGFFNDA